jgi:hypothetical protein
MSFRRRNFGLMSRSPTQDPGTPSPAGGQALFWLAIISTVAAGTAYLFYISL